MSLFSKEYRFKPQRVQILFNPMLQQIYLLLSSPRHNFYDKNMIEIDVKSGGVLLADGMGLEKVNAS